jgi:hypothetical protein
MFDFERLHQAARDARAKGKNRVLLPHGEFRQAMLTFYAVTKGKRALERMDENRFYFSAWGVELLNFGARSKRWRDEREN